jgi:hypothetical protein
MNVLHFPHILPLFQPKRYKFIRCLNEAAAKPLLSSSSSGFFVAGAVKDILRIGPKALLIEVCEVIPIAVTTRQPAFDLFIGIIISIV